MSEHATFKQRLQQRDPLLGFFSGIPSPAVVEMIAYTGFDFVIIDAEHGPMGMESIDYLVRTAQGAGITALVRVPHPSAIQQVLDLGADGIVVPHIRTVEDARALVDACYYTPLGKRGVSTVARSARFGAAGGAEYLANRHRHTVVMPMIEDVEALPNAAAIGALQGIDGLFVGPSDLSAAMNHPGQPNHPEVVAAIARVRDSVLTVKNVGLGTTGRGVADVAGTMKSGFNFIAFSAQLTIVSALRELMSALKPGK